MPTEQLKNCPLCSGHNLSDYLHITDHSVSKEEFTLQKCADCSFVFTNPRPDQQHIGSYYQSNDYISHHDTNTDLFSRVYNAVRNYTTRQKIKLIAKLVTRQHPTLLDYGTGAGYFSAAIQKKGYEVSTIEPDQDAANVAETRLGTRPSSSYNDGLLQTKSFDVITLWHVLEHVPNLHELLDWFVKHLNPDGKLIIAVPNPESEDAKEYGAYWAAYDVPRHLNHFTKTTLNKLIKQHGLRIETIHPMLFDAFYIGLLSTKYKHGQSDLIAATINGLRSNWKGNNSKQPNTSSLIYVISKEQNATK